MISNKQYIKELLQAKLHQEQFCDKLPVGSIGFFVIPFDEYLELALSCLDHIRANKEQYNVPENFNPIDDDVEDIIKSSSYYNEVDNCIMFSKQYYPNYVDGSWRDEYLIRFMINTKANRIIIYRHTLDELNSLYKTTVELLDDNKVIDSNNTLLCYVATDNLIINDVIYSDYSELYFDKLKTLVLSDDELYSKFIACCDKEYHKTLRNYPTKEYVIDTIRNVILPTSLS